MPRAFTDFERQKLRQRLLASGKRLINSVGVRNLTVDEAAREAGISKGSFYAFFPSKEDFILSVFETWEEEYRQTLLADILEGKGSALDRLKRFFEGLFAVLEREPGVARLSLREIADILDRLPPERLAAHQKFDDQVLLKELGHWVDRGILDGADLPALPGVIRSLFILALHREDYEPGTYAPAVRLIAEALALRIARCDGCPVEGSEAKEAHGGKK